MPYSVQTQASSPRPHCIDLDDLVIPTGAAVSNELDVREPTTLLQPLALEITAPAALDATTFTLVAGTRRTADTPAGVFGDQTSGGADVTIAAGDAVPLTDVAFRALRIRAGANVAAARTFKVVARYP